MEWLTDRLLSRRTAWGVVLTVVALALLAGASALRLEQEDDLLAFLPRDNADVELFHTINKSFGIADVALVGLEADDVFEPSFLTGLRTVSKRLDDLAQLNHVTSLANVADFTADEMRGGIVTAPLVDRIPTTDAEREALRAKVMSRDHIVGHLVSEDGRAVVLYCYLAYGADPKVIGATIRNIVEETLPEARAYWGGGPFVAAYIYETTQQDLTWLTPWAVLAIVLVMMLIFRDVVGTSVALMSTAIGIVIALGLMAAVGVRFNIVLSAMPVILFAVGSAYGVHVLSRYYALAETLGPAVALPAALRETGPVVIAAGLTTAVSLLSFVMMDIQPLRTFGIFTAIGIVACLILALTFIPAIILLAGLRHRPGRPGAMRAATAAVATWAHSHRVSTAAGLALLALTCAFFVGRVDTSVDYSTFFARGSPPDRAENFLAEHFGGSQFVQVHVRGDFNDPHVLREVRRIADQVSLMPEVSTVLHAGGVQALSNNAMSGQLRIPDTEAQVRLLYSFIDDPGLGQLVNADRSEGILHIKLRTSRAGATQAALSAIEQRIHIGTHGDGLVTRFTAIDGSTAPAQERLQHVAVVRVFALARQYGIQVDATTEQALRDSINFAPVELNAAPVTAEVARFLRSEENPVPLEDADATAAVAQATAALGPMPPADALVGAIALALKLPPADLTVEDLGLSLEVRLEELWREERARQRRISLFTSARLVPPDSPRGRRFTRAIETALLDLDSPTALQPAAADATGASTVTMQVNGLPVMHRGLSRSIKRNQVSSLAFALGLILVILSIMFRSIFTGLLATTPTLLTLLVVYGGMGLLGVHLDIGTSMLASLILGAGVDYAVHLVAAWQAPAGGDSLQAAAVAAARTGPAIWTNAVMIAVGFAVLTLGQAKPLQNVGSLTAAAMLTAAAATFLAVPALARRRVYRLLGGANAAPATPGDVVETPADDSLTQE